MEELAVLQASVAAVLAVMSLGRLSDLDAVAVLTAVEGLGRSIDAARVTAAAEVGGRAVRIAPGHSQPALPAALGCRDGLEVIVRATRVSVREAKRRSRLGEFVSVRNGVMLCWHHHHHINTSGWKIRTVHGSPQIKAPPWQDPHQNWHPASQNRARTTTATRH